MGWLGWGGGGGGGEIYLRGVGWYWFMGAGNGSRGRAEYEGQAQRYSKHKLIHLNYFIQPNLFPLGQFPFTSPLFSSLLCLAISPTKIQICGCYHTSTSVFNWIHTKINVPLLVDGFLGLFCNVFLADVNFFPTKRQSFHVGLGLLYKQ